MWISEQGRTRPQAAGTALVGQVTLPGDPAPCVAGALCGDDREVSPGEVLIYSGGSTVRLNGGNITISGGIVNLTGRVLVNGKIVVTEG